MQNTMAETPNEQNMNDILASIRQTITGELGINIEHSQNHGVGLSNNSSHDDVLELTQQVQDDGSILDLHKQIADLKLKFQSLSEFNADMNIPDEKKNTSYLAHDMPTTQPQSTQSKRIDDEKGTVDQGMLAQVSNSMDATIHDLAGINGTKAEQNAKAIDDIESMAEKFASSYNKQQEAIPNPTFEEQILSEKTVQDSLNALTSLQQLSLNPNQQDNYGHSHQQTIDSLVRELLKPMLKEWLDTNLPSLVKWIVTEQIERIMKERKI